MARSSSKLKHVIEDEWQRLMLLIPVFHAGNSQRQVELVPRPIAHFAHLHDRLVGAGQPDEDRFSPLIRIGPHRLFNDETDQGPSCRPAEFVDGCPLIDGETLEGAIQVNVGSMEELKHGCQSFQGD